MRWESIEARWSARFPRVLRWCAAGLAVFLVLLFAVSAAQRIRTPFEFEEHEGFAVQTVQHILDTGSLYPKPTFSFVPYLYSPGYYYATAAVAKVVGHGGYAVARGVSIASCLGTLLVLFLLVRRETGNALAGLIAAGMYAGAYPVCEAWFDLARLDSFYVFAVICAVYATRWFHPAIAALVWVAAIQCKQPVLPVAFVMLCWNWRDLRRTATGLVTLFLALAVAIALGMHFTGPWYLFYMFKVPKAVSDIVVRPLILFIPSNLFRPFGIASLMVLASAWLVLRKGITPRATFYLLTSAMFAVTCFQMGHGGSTVNVLMPAYALLAMLFGLSVAYLMRQKYAGAAEMVLLAVAVQLAGCIYNPGQWKATPEDRTAYAALETLMRNTPGDVYDVWHPYNSLLAGKPEHVDFNSLQDTLRALKPAEADQLRDEIATSLCRNTTAIVVDRPQGMENLAALLHRGEKWNARFTSTDMFPGASLHFRPAWVAYAKGGEAEASACAADKI